MELKYRTKSRPFRSFLLIALSVLVTSCDMNNEPLESAKIVILNSSTCIGSIAQILDPEEGQGQIWLEFKYPRDTVIYENCVKLSPWGTQSLSKGDTVRIYYKKIHKYEGPYCLEAFAYDLDTLYEVRSISEF